MTIGNGTESEGAAAGGGRLAAPVGRGAAAFAGGRGTGIGRGAGLDGPAVGARAAIIGRGVPINT